MAGITLNNPINAGSINPTNEILPVRTSATTFGDSKFFDNATARGIKDFTGIDVIKVDDAGGFIELGGNGSSANILLDELNQSVKIGNFGTPSDSPAIALDSTNMRLEIKGTDTIMSPTFTPNPSSFYLKFWNEDQNQYFYIHLERQ